MKPGMSAPVSSRHIRPIPESSYETARRAVGTDRDAVHGGQVGGEQVQPPPRAPLPDEDVSTARRHDPRVVRGEPGVRDCTGVLERGDCPGRDVEDARERIAVDGRGDDQPAVGLKRADLTARGCAKRLSCTPLATSHTRTVRSSLAVTSSRPSGENSTVRTRASCRSTGLSAAKPVSPCAATRDPRFARCRPYRRSRRGCRLG